MQQRLLVLLAAFLVASAGCIGFGGGDDDGNATDDDNLTDDDFDGNETEGDDEEGDEGDEAEGNVSDDGNATGPQPEWTSENRTGTVQGLGLVVTGPSAEETFNVENGTLKLVLNLSAEGGELTMTVLPPGCEEDACAQEAPTSSGNASVSIETPDAGGWTVRLEPATQAGPSTIDYDLTVSQLIGAAAG